eukprot:657962-Prymnesium_polylepis.1
MQPATKALLFLLPFGLVAWVHWLHSIQQERKVQVQTSHAPTLKQRDLIMSRRARLRWMRRTRSSATDDSSVSVSVAPLAVATPAATTAVDDLPVRVKAAGAALDASAAQAATSAEAAASAATPACPASRKPFHVLLTATAQVYQQWQCRV